MTSIARRITSAIFLASSLVVLPMSAIQAQEPYEQAKLESFVDATLEVNQLVEQWTVRIQGAQNETEAAELQQQANQALVASIEQAEGISLDEYKEISQAAQSDPALYARITEIIEENRPQTQPQ